MSMNRSPEETVYRPGASGDAIVYRLTDDEQAERDAFCAGMIHEDELLDWEWEADPDDSLINERELYEMYRDWGLI